MNNLLSMANDYDTATDSGQRLEERVGVTFQMARAKGYVVERQGIVTARYYQGISVPHRMDYVLCGVPVQEVPYFRNLSKVYKPRRNHYDLAIECRQKEVGGTTNERLFVAASFAALNRFEMPMIILVSGNGFTDYVWAESQRLVGQGGLVAIWTEEELARWVQRLPPCDLRPEETVRPTALANPLW